MNFQARIIILILFLVAFFSSNMVEALTKDDVSIQKCAFNRIDKRKGAIAISAIFRDEAPFLKEWIEYHRLVGVTHFYLYNNCSQDHYFEILKPYINQGIVELFDVPFDSYAYFDGAATHNFVQVCCYKHALKLSKGANDWLAIIDSDEFICPVTDHTIGAVLARYKRAGGVVIYWQTYGTSAVWELKPGELLIEKLTQKAPNHAKCLFKTIVRPKHAKKCHDPHWTSTKSGMPLVMPNDRNFSHTPKFDLAPVDVIRINHYTYRTESYYYNQKKQRHARWGYNPTPDEEACALEQANLVSDAIMLKYVPELKKRLYNN